MITSITFFLEILLVTISNFLYNGETFVSQYELAAFLNTAQELKVKGLHKVEEPDELQLDETISDTELKINEQSTDFDIQSVEEEVNNKGELQHNDERLQAAINNELAFNKDELTFTKLTSGDIN